MIRWLLDEQSLRKRQGVYVCWAVVSAVLGRRVRRFDELGGMTSKNSNMMRERV
jgi:hypothetical protein